MTLYTNILLDYENSIEILFTLLPGTTLSYPNEVIEYVRASDVKTVPHISSAGMREISFQMQTNVSKTLERQLDYFRRSGKSLLLFIPTEKFASEIVITDVSLPEIVSTYQTFTINAYCYGVEGQSYLASDSDVILSANATLTADSNALGGYTAKFLSNTDNMFFSTVADNVFVPAGNYLIVGRAKSKNSVADGVLVGALTTYGVPLGTDTFTASTSAYGYYVVAGTLPIAQYGATVNTLVQQWGTDSNEIYSDLVAYVHSSGLITI